jgi:hypothetical protein
MIVSRGSASNSALCIPAVHAYKIVGFVATFLDQTAVQQVMLALSQSKENQRVDKGAKGGKKHTLSAVSGADASGPSSGWGETAVGVALSTSKEAMVQCCQ